MTETVEGEPESIGETAAPERPRISPEQIAQLMQVHFAYFDDLTQRNVEGRLFATVEPGSQMAADDAMTTPYQFSHSLQALVGNAIEHGRAIVGLVRDAGVVQGAPPFTLARAAIESAGTAYWLLDGKDQAERITRHLRHHGQDRFDYAEVAAIMKARIGADLPPELEERKLYTADVARRAKLREKPSERLGTTRMMQSVDAAVDKAKGETKPTNYFELIWRVASGFGHGRPWARMNVLVRSDVRPISDDVATVRFVTDPARAAWSLSAAQEILDRTMEAYTAACQPQDDRLHQHPGPYVRRSGF